MACRMPHVGALPISAGRPATRCVAPRNVAVRAHPSRDHEELLRTLQALEPPALNSWAAANPDALTLSFMGWVADQEAAADGAQRQRLWDLGSRLMALREGLDPVGMEQLQEELAAAAAARSCTPAASTSGRDDSAALAVASPGLATTVGRTAGLGLSAQGLALLQQQAAALEAVVGTSRAKSLTEVIGRKRVASPLEAHRLLASDAAGRILEVLLSIDAREDRAAMLPDAFAPPAALDEDDESGYTSGSGADDDEELYTTPLQLLQAVDLQLARLKRGSDGVEPAGLLTGGGGGAGYEAALRELREDVLAYWEGASSDAF